MTADVALNDDGLLLEEAEVPAADEAADVPLDGDSRPGLGAAPLLLHLLVQTLLQEHLVGGGGLRGGSGTTCAGG